MARLKTARVSALSTFESATPGIRRPGRNILLEIHGNIGDVEAGFAQARQIYVDPSVSDYIVRLVNHTRTHPDVYLGASPRGSIALYRAGQALAGLLGRDYVIPDDIKALAEPALAHRLIIKTSSSIHDVQAGQVVRELIESTPIDGIRPTGGGPTDLRTSSRSPSAATNA
jgi:MoxR-like ATPase